MLQVTATRRTFFSIYSPAARNIILDKTKKLFPSLVLAMLFLAAAVSFLFSSPVGAAENQDKQTQSSGLDSLISLGQDPRVSRKIPETKVPQVISAPSIREVKAPTEPRRVRLQNREAVVFPNIQMHPSSTTTQSEMSIWTHPINPDIALAGANAVHTSVSIGSQGWYYTTNGGVNWTGGDTLPTHSNLSSFMADPAVGIDLDGNLFFNALLFGATGDLIIARSTDNGSSWTQVSVPNATNGEDKNHLAIDINPGSPFENNLYTAYTDFAPFPSPVMFSRSTNRGVSFTSPVAISGSIGSQFAQGINLAVSQDGELYAAWSGYDSWPPPVTTRLGFNKSTDGGVTWSTAVSLRNVNDIRGTLSKGGNFVRVNSFPSMAVDRSTGPRQGWIYIVYPEKNPTTPDIFLIRSTDGGSTWSSPVKVNQDNSGKDQWFSWITVDPITGVLYVVYYDSRNFPANDSAQVYISSSLDGGVTFEPDVLVSDVAFLPTPIPGLAGGYMGDYIGISAVNGVVWPCWNDNRTGIHQAYTSRIVFIEVGSPPKISVSPETLDFGEVFLGYPETLSIIVRNLGFPETLSVTNIQSDTSDFTPELTAFLVPGGSSRNVKVAFSPSDTGLISGTLTISSSDTTNPTVTVTLNGKGLLPPDISVTPETLSADLFVGGMDTETLTIANTGFSDLNFDIAIEGVSLLAASLNSQPDLSLEANAQGDDFKDILTVVDSLNSRFASVKDKAIMRSTKSVSGFTASGTNPETAAEFYKSSTLGFGDIAVLGADASLSLLNDIALYLINSGRFASVTTINGFSITPTLAELQVFDAVGVFGWNFWLDPNAIGNLLADYVDGGGKVFMAFAANGFGGGWMVQGRFDSDNYWLISPYNYEGGGAYSMGTVFEPGHPIMNGVNTLTSGSKLLNGATVTAGATLLASFTDGTPLAAIQQVGGSRRVDISFPFFTSVVNFWGVDATTDADLLITNAFEWLAHGASWLSADPDSGTVPAGGSMDIEVTFDATGLNGGDYYSNILISSNDPDEPQDTTPVHLHVTGAPDIAVSNDTLDYGSVFIGGSVTETLVVSNEGTDLLIVTDITSDNPNYTVNIDTFSLNPGDEQNVLVTFTPLDTGLFIGNLTIVSNDPDEDTVMVLLNGTGLLPPDIVVSPDSLSADLFTGEMKTETLTISNTGFSDLNFDISIEGADGVAISVKTLANQFREPPPTISTNPGSVTTTSEALSIWEANGIEESTYHQLMNEFQRRISDEPQTLSNLPGKTVSPTSSGMVIEGFDTTASWPWAPWVVVLPGGFVTTTCAHDGPQGISDPEWHYRTDVSLGSPGQKVSLWVKPGSGRAYMGFGASSAGAWSLVAAPNTGELIIQRNSNYFFEQLAAVPQSWSIGAWYKLEVTFGESSLVIGNLYASDGTTLLNTVSTTLTGFQPGGVAIRSFSGFCEDTFEKGSVLSWLSTVPVSGTIPAGNSMDIEVTFDATGLNGGDYYDNILISSNDPDEPQDTTPVHLHVTGAPDIAVSKETLDYGSIFIGGSKTETLVVSNIGTDSLKVSNITSDNPNYTVNITNFNLDPAQKQNVLVTFTPSDTGLFIGHLTIVSNDPDEDTVMVLLNGTGLLPPDISVSPDSLSADLFTGEMKTETLTISNTGFSDLNFDISIKKVLSSLSSKNANLDIFDKALKNDMGIEVSGRNVNTRQNNNLAKQSNHKLLSQDWLKQLDQTSYTTVTGNAIRFSSQAALNNDFQIDTSKAIAVFGGGNTYGISTFLQSQGFNAVVVSETDILGGILNNYDVLVMARTYYLLDSAGVRTAIEAFVSNGAGLVTEWSSSTRLFSSVGPAPYVVEVPQWKWYAGAIGHGDYVGYGTPIDIIDPSHPLAFNLPDPFSGGGATEYFFTVSGYTSELEAVAQYTGHGGTWPALMVGNFGQGSVVMHLFDSGDDLTQANIQQLWVNSINVALSGIGWLSANPSEGVVPAGNSMDIEVTFDATGLNGGDYYANILISSNDPDEPQDTTPVHLHVTGAPDIAVSPETLDYDTVFVTASAVETLVISNVGTDSLAVIDITSDNPDYIVNITNFSLDPGEKQNVLVTFTPPDSGLFIGHLTIVSNDPDEDTVMVLLNGTGLLPPDIVVTPESLSADLFTGEMKTETLTISNTGFSDLNFDISIEGIAVAKGSVSAKSSPKNLDLRLSNKSLNSFSSKNRVMLEPTQNGLLSGPNEKVGKSLPHSSRIGANPANVLIAVANDPGGLPNELSQLHNTLIDLGFDYVDVNSVAEAEAAGASALIVRYAGVQSFTFSEMDNWVKNGGGLLQLGDWVDYFPNSWTDIPEGLLITINVVDASHPVTSGLPSSWMSYGFWRYDYSFGDFIGYVTDLSFPNLVSANGYQRVVSAAEIGMGKAVYIGTNIYGEDATSQDIKLFSNALHWVTGGANWLSSNPTSGTIPAGDSMDIEVTFDATGLNGGDYYANILISSNDPDEPQDTTPVHLHVTGAPDIAVSKDTLDYGSVFIGGSVTETLVVSNEGTDLLTVSDITSDNSNYSVNITNFNLNPGQKQNVLVTFTPPDTGLFTGNLTILSDDPDQDTVVVFLQGEGLLPPDISVTPDSFAFKLKQGDSTQATLTIENTGLSDLIFDISIENVAIASVLAKVSSSELEPDKKGKVSFAVKKNGSESNIEVSKISGNEKIGFYADTNRTKSSVQLPDEFTNPDQGKSLAIGDVLGTYANFPYGNHGMVWVGKDLYVVHNDQRALRLYDIQTQQVVATYTIHYYPYGIAWDGQYLWIGNNVGNIYAYDLNGNNMGSFSSPISNYNSLTWDGQYFIVNYAFGSYPIFYRIDYTGAIVESFTSSYNGIADQTVWVPPHTDGKLWANDPNNAKIVQFSLANGVASVVREFYFYDNESSYSIGHNGIDLWWSDWGGPLYQIDDGIKEWLSTIPTSDTIPAGSSMDISVNFDAIGVNAGDYFANILLSSNDPDEPQVRVPATLKVIKCVAGDVDGDEYAVFPDIIFLVDYVFRGGPRADCRGDVNADGKINLGDIMYLVIYLFRDGPEPVPGCCL